MDDVFRYHEVKRAKDEKWRRDVRGGKRKVESGEYTRAVESATARTGRSSHARNPAGICRASWLTRISGRTKIAWNA